MDATTQDHLVAGVRTGNTTCWTAFITGHLSMVYDGAQGLSMSPDQHEELVDVGRVALCESGRAYCDGSFDCRFTTYAHTRIRRAMISYQRTEGGLSSEWMARVSSRTRKDMENLRQRFASMGIDHEPTVEDLAYVSVEGEPTDDDVRKYALRLQGTPKFVPLGNEHIDETGEPDIDFAATLSPATRHIWCGMVEQMVITGDASLSLEASRNEITREEVYSRMVMARTQWRRSHGD